jgi:hypothetical protein
MQIEHKPVNEANSGQRIGLKTDSEVRVNDILYKIQNNAE